MKDGIFREFIEVECSDYVRSLLLQDIEELENSKANAIKEYEFNRFNVRIDFSKREVSIEDDLTTGPEGQLVIGLDLFVRTLKPNKTEIR